jgi:hypothetical protein
MTRVLRLAIVTLLLTGLPALADGPAATIDEPILDVGETPVGETIEAEFTLHNEGSAPLEITRVRPACGCTVAEYDEEIAPGGTGVVRATVDTRRLSGPNAKTVTVYTNDPRNPRIQLTIKSDVRPFLLLRPGYARLTDAVQGETEHRIPQLLWADDFENLQILEVESPRNWIDVSFREATPEEREPEAAGTQWHLDVAIDENAPAGPIADHVVITTNHPVQREVKLPVSGFIRPLVAVTPPKVDFGSVDLSKQNAWGVLVRNFGSEPLEIESVDSDVPGLEVTVEPIEEGVRYKLVMEPTSAMTRGRFDGRVELRTNLPRQRTIRVSLSGEVM